jgi:hypothetical protein
MPKAVEKRLVFYCHGYDPEADTRYRRLFVTAFAQLSRRFRVRREIGPVVHDAALPADRWTVVAAHQDWRTETVYEVLRWDDLVKRDFARGWRVRLPLLAATLAQQLRSGFFHRMFRVNWHFALFVIYPWAALVAACAGGVLLGYGAAELLTLVVPLGPVAVWVIALAIAAIFVRGLRARMSAAFVYHLLDGWIFQARQAGVQDADLAARLDRFTRHVVDTVRDSDADEILIVGHSTGSTIACEITAGALALDPRLSCRAAPIALLTIGASLPFVAFFRGAAEFRRKVARLVVEPSLLWVEYQAPQDVMNAFGFDPARDLTGEIGDALPINPRIRSARFKETLRPASYRRLCWNFFRMHFNFLAANELPGEYDYLMIACGPVTLADRIADPRGAIRRTYGMTPDAGSTPMPETGPGTRGEPAIASGDAG